jgi:methionyl-tRNA formyltransferase
MKITLLCSSFSHPVYSYLLAWVNDNISKYEIQLINRISEVEDNGDILFLISCSEIITAKHRDKFRYTLVLHASDLPEGRGWSPHIWEITNGSNELTLSLLNAEDRVDTGDIWQKKKIKLTGAELYDEINDLLFNAELDLISWACEYIDNAKALPQLKIENTTNYRQRTPDDSELDPERSISSQFNVLRVCDPNRFPAYFYLNGQKYTVTVTREKK